MLNLKHDNNNGELPNFRQDVLDLSQFHKSAHFPALLTLADAVACYILSSDIVW